MGMSDLRLATVTPKAQPDPRSCPHAEKCCFATWVAADAYLQDLRRRAATHRSDKIPHRAYFCVCKSWHLASTQAKCGVPNRLVSPAGHEACATDL